MTRAPPRRQVAQALQHQRQECEHSTLSLVVRAQYEHEVLDRDDQDQRPEDQGKNPVDVCRRGSQAARVAERLLDRIEGTRSDVTVNDTECREGEDCKPPRVRAAFFCVLHGHAER